MSAVLIIGLSWLVVSVVTALLIAGSIRIAERRRFGAAPREQDNVVVDTPTGSTPVRSGPVDSGQRVVLLFAPPAQRSLRAPWETGGR